MGDFEEEHSGCFWRSSVISWVKQLVAKWSFVHSMKKNYLHNQMIDWWAGGQADVVAQTAI